MTDFVIGDEEFTEVNTSYDQEQPIGDSPQALYSVGAEPINAKNGSGFMDVGRLGESHECKTNDDYCICETCDTDADEYHNMSCKTCKRTKGLLYGENIGCKFCNNKFSLLNMTPEGDISCPKCGKGFGKKEGFEKLNTSYYECPECDYRRKNMEDFLNHLQNIHNYDYRRADDTVSIQTDVIESNEKLNKDGTGVARAVRGINPNNNKHVKMMFDYVSGAGCKICSQYDGVVFDRNDEKRPIIPRLEVSGWSARPYTHPNCKCRWIKVFNEVNTNNNMQANEIAPELIARGKAWYGDGWDELKLVEKQLIVIKMLQKSLGMNESLVEEPVPMVGIEAHQLKLKANEYAGQPMAKPHNYGIQRILDGLVGSNLHEAKKNEIEDIVSKDFTLENLLALTAKALADKLGKKLGVEGYNKNTGEMECEKCEAKFSPNDDWQMDNYKKHMKTHTSTEYNDLWYASQYAKLPHWQSDRFTDSDSLKDKTSKLFSQYGFDITEQDIKSGKYGLDERMPVELMANILSGKTNESLVMRHRCPQCHIEFNTNDEVITHMLVEDHGINFEDIEDSRYNESYGNEDHASDYWKEYNYAKRMIEDENISEKGDELQWKLMEQGISVMVADRIANEGGKGSGKSGHSPWMLGTYLAEECPHCMISTERENGKCVICRN